MTVRPSHVLGLVVFLLSLGAEAAPRLPEPVEVQPLTVRSRPGEILGTPLGGLQPSDTLYFGGTRWDVQDERWEALLDSVWTFETGVATTINQDPNRKEVGYHDLMEGWRGLDMTAPSLPFNPIHRDTTCAIEGWSLWGGVDETLADSLGWPSGAGYGNSWMYSVAREFTYSGEDTVRLAFDYRVQGDVEEKDMLRVTTEWPHPKDEGFFEREITRLTGVSEGTAEFTLTYPALPRDGGPFTIVFTVWSDEIESNEDGAFTTDCGLAVIDNIVVTLPGESPDTTNFETGMDGWSLRPPWGLGGDWSDVRALSTLDQPDCACAFGDSVLTFLDASLLSGTHNLHQYNLAVSPWMDLAAEGLSAKSGKLLEFTGYLDLNMYTEYLYLFVFARWLPETLPSPLNREPVRGFYHVGGAVVRDSCFCAPEWAGLDLSDGVPPNAEQVQVAVGIINYCRYYAGCESRFNQSPWLDDIRVGIFDREFASSRLRIDEKDIPRDAFPTSTPDGDLATSVARFDAHRILEDGSLQDYLVVASDFNPEPSRVDVVFRVRPGPGIDRDRFDAWLAGFAPEENGWVSARMDSLGHARYRAGLNWWTTFHEEDPQFVAPQDAPDPEDPTPPGAPTRVRNDMFPDDLFTPGTRVELFYRWSSDHVSGPPGLAPDTTGGNFLEMEVLPSSITLAEEAGEPEHNRVLLVGRSRRGDVLIRTVEEALGVLMPEESANAENRAWDRFDIHQPQDMALATPDGEHDTAYLDGYDRILWFTEPFFGSSQKIGEADQARLADWLACAGGGSDGDNGCGRTLYLADAGGPWRIPQSNEFYQSLGIESLLGSIYWDDLRCIELVSHEDATFGQGFRRLIDVDSWETTVLTPVAQGADAQHEISLVYETPEGPKVASIATEHIVRTGTEITGYWRAVMDATMPDRWRAGDDCAGEPDGALERMTAVLGWLDDDSTPVDLVAFDAVRRDGEVILTWRTGGSASDHVGFHVYRETPEGSRVGLTSSLLTGLVAYEFVDDDPPPESVRYWLAEHLRDGAVRWLGPAEAPSVVPPAVLTVGATPNPFSTRTRLELALPLAGHVDIRIYDTAGREVARPHSGRLSGGSQEIRWDGRDSRGRVLPAGVYLYRVETGAGARTGKLVKTIG